MKNLSPLKGRKATKEEMVLAIEGPDFMQRLGHLLEPLAADVEIQDVVMTYIAHEIEEFKETVLPINDIDELQYLLAICYTNFKAKWIQFNTKMNYMNEGGLEPSIVDIYKASSLSHILDVIEPLTHPDAVRAITQTLDHTFRELNAA